MVISPAKKMDFSHDFGGGSYPEFMDETRKLVRHLKKLSVSDLQSLMGISRNLAELNYSRYQHFGDDSDGCAAMVFSGDVYRSLGVGDFDDGDWAFAGDHLRILSGLYGVLRPLDRIYAYRLEMGVNLSIGGGEGLYDFWGGRIGEVLGRDLGKSGGDILLNLASVEYFRSVDLGRVGGRVLHVHFREDRGGEVRTIALLAKRARGMMARFIIKNRLVGIDGVMDFSEGGYRYSKKLSDDDNLVFIRKSA